MRGRVHCILLASLAAMSLLLAFGISASAQQLAKRLILKDGSYQLATKYEIKGERVRYFSAERGNGRKFPNPWWTGMPPTKYEKDRASGAPPPEAVELDRELEAERKAEEAKTPQVAPGLRLSDTAAWFYWILTRVNHN